MVADYRAYTPGGCLVFCTTPVESISHAAIAEDLRRVIAEIDAVLETRFEQAQVEGDFPASGDCALAGQLAQALLHSLALRACSGTTRRELDKLVQYGISVLLAESTAKTK
jgi:AcrR family transcriptional regulator